MKTHFGAGELAVTSEGLLLVDFGTRSVVEASWEQIHKQAEAQDGVVRLGVDLEGFGLLKITIPERLSTSIAALRSFHAATPAPEGESDGWVWQRAPLFVTEDLPNEIDLTSSVVLQSPLATEPRSEARRSPLLFGALAIAGLAIGFGVVSQLGSDSTPQIDPSVQVAGITTTPGVVTTAAGSCNENYEPCVPVADDVDCEGGLGDGPAYVKGPVKVVGSDVYRIDTDGDGIACGLSDMPADEDFSDN